MIHELDDNRELLESDGTPFTAEQRLAHFEFLKNQHVHKRQYPPIEEQLDMIYWDQVNGTTKFKEMIDEIKTNQPKTDTSDMSQVTDEFGN
jgi:hypothetical protein